MMKNEKHQGLLIAPILALPAYMMREDGKLLRMKKDNTYRIIHGKVNQKGYVVTVIKGKTYLFHRLVAQAFIPNPENYATVDHINECKTDNRPSNLRWCSMLQNIEYYTQGPSKRERTQILEDASSENARLLQVITDIHKDMEAVTATNSSLELVIKDLTFRVESQNTIINHLQINTKSIVEPTPTPPNAKAITVSNILYPSAGAAAQYIVDQEAILGNTRKKATVSKELRRYLQGKRPSWKMYNLYHIGN